MAMANGVHAARIHSVPMFEVSRLVELTGRWHIPADELLAHARLTSKDLEDPLARVPLTGMCALLERARLLTGEPGLGYYRGLQMRASWFGTLGFATQAAASLRDALELGRKYSPLFSTAVSLDLRVEGGTARLYLEENADFGDARDIVLITLCLGLRTIFRALTGRNETNSRVELAIPEPPYQERFQHLAQNWSFRGGSNHIAFDAPLLDTPILSADPEALRVVQTLCDRALDELDFDVGLIDAVRRCIVSASGGFRTLEEVAHELHVSDRTLKRRLAARGVSFSELADRERMRQAVVLLRSFRLTIADIASRLGYSTESSFVRAFRRWMGTTPAAYRRLGDSAVGKP